MEFHTFLSVMRRLLAEGQHNVWIGRVVYLRRILGEVMMCTGIRHRDREFVLTSGVQEDDPSTLTYDELEDDQRTKVTAMLRQWLSQRASNAFTKWQVADLYPPVSSLLGHVAGFRGGRAAQEAGERPFMLALLLFTAVVLVFVTTAHPFMAAVLISLALSRSFMVILFPFMVTLLPFMETQPPLMAVMLTFTRTQAVMEHYRSLCGQVKSAICLRARCTMPGTDMGVWGR
eukprot:897696-Rhodomonas_salina.4